MIGVAENLETAAHCKSYPFIDPGFNNSHLCGSNVRPTVCQVLTLHHQFFPYFLACFVHRFAPPFLPQRFSNQSLKNLATYNYKIIKTNFGARMLMCRLWDRWNFRTERKNYMRFSFVCEIQISCISHLSRRYY